MSTFRTALRNHLHFIVVVGVLLIVMTWPTVVYVFNTEIFWLPTDGRDVWMNIWDAWHGRSVFAGEASPYFTDMLFYPIGVSLEYNPNNMIQRTLFWILQSFMGTSNAFGLIYLLIVIATAWSAYVYINYLFDDRWLALFGAVVFGFSQHVVGHANHPMVNLLATVPLALYALQRGLDEQNLRWILLSGILVGITAFVGLYIFVCLLLTLGLYFLCFTYSKWRQPRFWIGTVLLVGVAASISLIHIYPLIRDSSKLNQALEKNVGREFNNDLLSSFVNGGHPWLTPIFVSVFDLESSDDFDIRHRHHTSYLGYLPLLLVALGLGSSVYRGKMRPWLLLLVPFLILRLGSALRINGELYPEILLPKHFLNAVFPAVFQAIYATDHFQIGVLLPLAVLSCFGLQAVLKSARQERRPQIVLVAIALLAFEYYQTPTSQIVLPEELAYNEWLRKEPNQEHIRLINLPMGRRSSKLYGFYQTINEYPHVEGLANRTPEEAYNYIRQNHLLANWRKRTNPECGPDSFDRYLAATDQLLSDSFSHVIHHHRERDAERVADSFTGISPAYQDEYVSIYRLPDLHDMCRDRVADYQNQLPVLKAFLQSPFNHPQADVSLIYLHPAGDYSSEGHRYYDITLSEWKDQVHIVHDEQGTAVVTNRQMEYTDLDSIASENSIFWLIYSLQLSDLRNTGGFANWKNNSLRSCQQIYGDESLIVEYLIDRVYPCELVMSEDPMEVLYDNGINLANVLTDLDGDRLSMDFWWQRGSIRGYAYTIQIFDEQGEKQLQIDQVIESRPLSRAQLDISSLEPGDYVAKLIVYDMESGESQSGTVRQDQIPLRRELDIARFTVGS